MTRTRWNEARAPRGMVATPHVLASESGLAALRAGGNALDAAIAAAAAIAYARDGFSASAGQRVAPPAEPDLFGPTAIAPIKEHLWPLYHPDALAQGPLVQRDLALTLEAVRDGGPDAFYGGDIARRIVAAVSAAGSPLSREDFAEHKSEWV